METLGVGAEPGDIGTGPAQHPAHRASPGSRGAYATRSTGTGPAAATPRSPGPDRWRPRRRPPRIAGHHAPSRQRTQEGTVPVAGMGKDVSPRRILRVARGEQPTGRSQPIDTHRNDRDRHGRRRLVSRRHADLQSGAEWRDIPVDCDPATRTSHAAPSHHLRLVRDGEAVVEKAVVDEDHHVVLLGSAWTGGGPGLLRDRSLRATSASDDVAYLQRGQLIMGGAAAAFAGDQAG